MSASIGVARRYSHQDGVVIEALQRALSSVPLRRAAEHAGISHKRLAYCRDGEAQIRLTEVLALPDEARDAVLADVAEALGRVLVAAPDHDRILDDLAATFDRVRRAGRRVEDLGDELDARTHLDAEAGAQLEELAEALASAALTLREWGRVARRERVIGVRRAR